MGKLEFCGKCPHKKEKRRPDIYPVALEYWCHHPNLNKPEWIGFIKRKPEFCPLVKPKNCDDCCACCMGVSMPPGYTGEETLFFVTEEDERRFNGIPEEAAEAIWLHFDYVEGLPNGELLPQWPCCWLDVKAKQCRWYDLRPSVCREFEIGGESCLSWREELTTDQAVL